MNYLYDKNIYCEQEEEDKKESQRLEEEKKEQIELEEKKRKEREEKRKNEKNNQSRAGKSFSPEESFGHSLIQKALKGELVS